MPDSIWSAIGRKIEVRHQLDGVARRPVLAGLLVVLLVEAADQLLEDRAHRVVVEAGGLRAVAVEHGLGLRLMSGSRNFSISVPSASALRESRDLVAELEVVEDVLHVRREAVEVGLEVGLELLLAGAGPQVAQRELRGVVEGLAGGLRGGPGPGW